MKLLRQSMEKRLAGWVSQSPLSKKELLSRLSGERADPLSSFEIRLCPGLLIVMQRKIGRDTLLCALVLYRYSFLERDGSCFSRLIAFKRDRNDYHRLACPEYRDRYRQIKPLCYWFSGNEPLLQCSLLALESLKIEKSFT